MIKDCECVTKHKVIFYDGSERAKLDALTLITKLKDCSIIAIGEDGKLLVVTIYRSSTDKYECWNFELDCFYVTEKSNNKDVITKYCAGDFVRKYTIEENK